MPEIRFARGSRSSVWLLVAVLAGAAAAARDHAAEPETADYFGAARFTYVNCTRPTIEDFPPDMFTQEERQTGAVAVHFALAIYAMLMIGVVIDEYFVPCLELLARLFNMSPDVAGATLMAIGTSSPELFINIVGTFITQGDIGVGTIVGSAVFNILAAPACCGLFTGFVVALDWWPLTRDCLIYGCIVVGLGAILFDGRIFWWEAAILVSVYAVYLLVMYMNERLEGVAKRWARSCRGCRRSDSKDGAAQAVDNVALEITGDDRVGAGVEAKRVDGASGSLPSDTDEQQDGPVDLLTLPQGSLAARVYWLFMWPGNLVFFLTVPDVRRSTWIWNKLFPITFIMCILWIGSLTYLVTWFITVIGYTLGIPDSAMGITFLAAGGSVPEAVATVVVARNGHGSMGISNSVGSNSFDVMICMGLPWLIKAAALPAFPDQGNFVVINSGGVVVSVGMLFLTVAVLYLTIAFNKFRLDRKTGAILLLTYLLFLVLAGCLEMNVFFPVNPPPC